MNKGLIYFVLLFFSFPLLAIEQVIDTISVDYRSFIEFEFNREKEIYNKTFIKILGIRDKVEESDHKIIAMKGFSPSRSEKEKETKTYLLEKSQFYKQYKKLLQDEFKLIENGILLNAFKMADSYNRLDQLSKILRSLNQTDTTDRELIKEREDSLKNSLELVNKRYKEIEELLLIYFDPKESRKGLFIAIQQEIDRISLEELLIQQSVISLGSTSKDEASEINEKELIEAYRTLSGMSLYSSMLDKVIKKKKNYFPNLVAPPYF